MEINNTKQSEQKFGSKIGLILAAAGSAVGLGNLMFVPNRVDAFGALFFIPYLLIMLVVGLPLMCGEFALGRSRRQDCLGATNDAPSVGWFGILGAMAIMLFYFILGGAVIMTMFYSWFGNHGGDASKIKEYLESAFLSGENVKMNYGILAACAAGYIGLNWFILWRGVKDGIEVLAKYAMPALVLTLLGLAIYGVISGGQTGLENILTMFTKWDFTPHKDFGGITDAGGVIGSAAAKAFLTLSLSTGVMITYGSYMQKQDNITNSSALTISSVALVVLLASTATLGLGSWFAMPPVAVGLLMLLVLVAALTSSISLMEALVASFGTKMKKTRVQTLTGLSVAVLAISVGGILLMANGIAFIDNVDAISEKFLYLLGGFFLSLYLGWRSKPWGEFNEGFFVKYYKISTRWIIPPVLLFLWMQSVGIIEMFLK